jgi:preprotein translocase subunit SecB
MAETPNGAAAQPPLAGAQPGAQPQLRVQVLGQYVKDMSFENAVAQGVKPSTAGQPDIQVQVSLDAKKREADHQFEVTTKFKVESRNRDDGKTLFLIELEYGGIFHIEGVPQEQMHPFLLIECPRILFPFVRRIISDITRDGGFVPLNLEIIDFMALYRQELTRLQAQGTKPAAPTA